MNNLIRKQILCDPIAALKQYSIVLPANKTEEIINLHLNYLTAKDKFKETKNLQRSFSRKIGDAKRNNKHTDYLIAEMKSVSHEVKSQTKTISEYEDIILSLFNNNSFIEPKKVHPELSFHSQRKYSNKSDTETSVKISLLKDEHDLCNQYVLENHNATLYHRTEWMNLIQTTFGHHCYYYIASNANNDITGVLPLVQLNSALFGNFMVSMPYFNYGGAIADDADIEKQLIMTANKQALDIGISHIEYRDDCKRDFMPAKGEKVNMLLALPETTESLWSGFTPKLRAQIKRPKNESPTVTFGSLDCLDDFYTVFARNMRDLGTPVYGKSFFKNILLQFPDNSTIVTIHLNGKPVAAAFLIGYRDTLEIPWASTISNVNHLSINMFLYWEVLQYAVTKKYHYFDFGRSSKDSGTYRFKRQWGATAKPLYWHYWLSAGQELPSLNPSNPKYALVISIWKRMPIALTKLIGPLIVKYLP